MLYETIVLKNRYLSNKLTQNILPKRAEITELLDTIIYLANIIESNKQLKQLMILFRKWYNLSIHFYGYYYNQTLVSLSKSEVKQKSQNYKSKNIINTIIKADNTEDVSLYIKKLTELVNPYSMFYKRDLSIIDNHFYENYSSLDILLQAQSDFKQSKLSIAQEKYYNVMEHFERKRKLDNAMLYFYSWALHGLGNIEFVKYNYNKAHKFYSDSVRIKEQINDLPKIMLYSTQAKMAITSICQITLSEWNNNIFKMVLTLENNSDTSADNPIWYYNILIDLLYQLSKGYYYLENTEKSKNYCDKTINIAEKYNDDIGIIKCQILSALIAGKINNSIKKIEHTLKSIEESKKINPFLRIIISSPYINEIMLINKSFANHIIKLFTRNNIQRLKFK